MWKQQSHILAPLSVITKESPKAKLTWGPQQPKAFVDMKQAISADVMLSFPNFSMSFKIHMDTSDYQLCAIIMQKGKPIAFYSQKLAGTPRNNTVGKCKMLSIDETLKRV